MSDMAIPAPTTKASAKPLTRSSPLIVVQRNLGWVFSVLALCAALAILLAIFWFVLSRGLPALKPQIFTTVTSGVSGGLENAILGTLMLVVFAVIMVAIIGFGTGVWLSNYASPKPRALVRLLTDVLAGVPSVVVGYFGYILLVKMAGWQFSLAGGAIALMIIMLPYVVRGTDLALEAVPRELREGSFALGATYTTVLRTVSWPYALPSVFTMLLLATGIALGETAPLIYTAGWSNYLPSTHLTHSPVPYLTYVIWTFISQPFAESHALAFAAAAILMIMILITNVFARSWLENLAKKQRGER
ncbi:MAG: phosphate ABC transporter permease PstA [Candidatus Eremiobacteraeota bacterium]|nr:phosphate ABC transporter permease PstA [Candidatus Eremiobacteraeota bacterium]